MYLDNKLENQVRTWQLKTPQSSQLARGGIREAGPGSAHLSPQPSTTSPSSPAPSEISRFLMGSQAD